ncbi:3' terminal RNA ribose 2'-O-methyltransferase Hen1 [Actinorugispora endophytica]|uniref:Small RNA 2'-O-methyltransferase n=1 Tax=Actinorugispora endophytica TaxID=1605990 RepID=A0A4R6UVX0_9ACTN|nr:3' terminal RNA ribose 2'-O-methyltransferase Hen1 [Actinorugispora endophytica]TDQ51412.1 3' terminal RNA ribose 2'-O-methyltransferase Hen1 [Actinorugispora endophytica]
MLLTISTTHRPADDLGFLLHSRPDRVRRFEQPYGAAHVFYPEAGPERCTAALLLEVDPHALRRARNGRTPDFALAQYVNDRPYAASSLFAVALGDVFRAALRGRCEARPELADTPLPLVLGLPAVPCRGGPDLARRLFEPLGWAVRAEPVPLDPGLPGWGDSRYVALTLSGELRLADALGDLCLLLPVLDDAGHYRLESGEADELLRAGGSRLAAHPLRDLVTSRYLSWGRGPARTAVERLAEVEGAGEGAGGLAEEDAGRGPALAEQRTGAVLSVLRAEGVRDVIDLGCGSGGLLERLLDETALDRVTGVDVSADAVGRARRRLRADGTPGSRRRRLDLFEGSVLYRDARFAGYDAAVLAEVVEHIDPARLPAMERVVFGDAAPRLVVVTTPNAEYGVRCEERRPGGPRRADRRFEWTRAEFRAWADAVAETYGYRVRYLPVGPEDPVLGPTTQMGVLTR